MPMRDVVSGAIPRDVQAPFKARLNHHSGAIGGFICSVVRSAMLGAFQAPFRRIPGAFQVSFRRIPDVIQAYSKRHSGTFKAPLFRRSNDAVQALQKRHFRRSRRCAGAVFQAF